MLRRNFAVFLTTLLFAWNAAALSYVPCLSADACKSVMGHGFHIEYRTALIQFLSENLYALQNAATELRADFPADDSNYTKLTTIADASVHLREIIENPGELNNEKLAQVIQEVGGHWAAIHDISPDKSKYQVHLNRVSKAMYSFAESVLQSWEQASLIAGSFKSEFNGFEAIDADVQKSKGLSYSPENLHIYGGLMSRILEFFEVDKSIILSHTDTA